MVARDDLAELLDEQAGFYRAVAAEYDDHALPLPGGREISEALDAFRPTGSVLELACGPGTWTGQLLRYASDVTAVDASAEMLRRPPRSIPTPAAPHPSGRHSRCPARGHPPGTPDAPRNPISAHHQPQSSLMHAPISPSADHTITSWHPH